MGLLETEIEELRAMQKKVYSGEVSLEIAATQIAISNQIAKREQMIYNLTNLQAKHGAKSIRRAMTTNLLGDGTAINLDSDSEEVIICPAVGGKCIGRETCLDYSGQSRNIESCQLCEQFEKTRKYCLGSVD